MATVRRRSLYLLMAAVLFALLVLIEGSLTTGFIRHTVGDALVVVFVYAVIMAFSRWSRFVSAGLSLAVAYAVEISQALNLIERLGLSRNRLTDAIFGSTFTWQDIAAYTVGIALTLIVEELVRAVGFQTRPSPTRDRS